MSSAGIRTMTPRVSPAPPASSASRRPPRGAETAAGATQVAAGRARDHPFRRWPPRAPRGPSMSPRPAAPGPALKTQRPDKSMTKEELLAMMRSGQLSNLQSPGGGAGGAGGGQRPAIPAAGLVSGLAAHRRRTAGGAPGLRRGPGPAPVAPAAAAAGR